MNAAPHMRAKPRARAAFVDPIEAALLADLEARWAGSRTESTQAQYVAPWAAFKAWCAYRPVPFCPLPALPLHVAMWLETKVQRAVADGLSYSYIKTASGAVYFNHTVICLPSPTESLEVTTLLKSAQRALGGRPVNRKEPLDVGVVKQLSSLWSKPKVPLWQLTVATWAIVAFAGFLRFSDAALIQVQDVKFCEGYAVIFLSQRKNDQFREGSLVYVSAGDPGCCPVVLMRRLIREAGLTPKSALFQGWDGRQKEKGLSGKAVQRGQLAAKLQQGIAEVLEVPLEDVCAMYSTHSLRSGGATAAAGAFVSERLFQAHGGWKSKEAMHAYIQESVASKLSVSASLGY